YSRRQGRGARRHLALQTLRKNQRWSFLQRAWYPGRLFAECEVLGLCLLSRDRHLLGLLAKLLVPCDYGVVAGRKPLYCVRAIRLAAHGRERMGEHTDIGLHPRVLVALDGNKLLRLVEFLLYWSGSRRLRLIPLRVLTR